MSAHTPALDSPLYTGKTERDAPGSLYAPSLRAPAPSHYRPRLYVAAVIMSLPGWLFGFDTGSIGPVTSMPLFPALSAGLQGFVVALMLITALLASLLAGPVSDKLGRRRTVAIGCAVHAVGSALCVASSGLGLFLAGRAIAGLGEGLFLSQSGVWAVESAPKERRGRLGGLSQLCIILGLCAGYFVCYGSVNINSLWSWRTPYLCQTALAATLCGLILTKLVPESPRWTLLRTDDVAGALRVVDAFAQTPASGETEKAELVLRTAAERADVAHARAAGAGGWLARIGFGGIADCFQKREDRRWKTLTAVVFMAIQQLSGIDAVLFYAPTIFSSAGLSSTNASFLASGITGIIGIVVTFPAQHWMMDRVGRRTMLVGGGIVMSVVMLTIGAIYASGAGETSRAAKWVVVACIYIYVAACVARQLDQPRTDGQVPGHLVARHEGVHLRDPAQQHAGVRARPRLCVQLGREHRHCAQHAAVPRPVVERALLSVRRLHRRRHRAWPLHARDHGAQHAGDRRGVGRKGGADCAALARGAAAHLATRGRRGRGRVAGEGRARSRVKCQT